MSSYVGEVKTKGFIKKKSLGRKGEVWVDRWAEGWVGASQAWAEGWVDGGMCIRVVFININNMYSNAVGKGGGAGL